MANDQQPTFDPFLNAAEREEMDREQLDRETLEEEVSRMLGWVSFELIIPEANRPTRFTLDSTDGAIVFLLKLLLEAVSGNVFSLHRLIKAMAEKTTGDPDATLTYEILENARRSIQGLPLLAETLSDFGQNVLPPATSQRAATSIPPVQTPSAQTQPVQTLSAPQKRDTFSPPSTHENYKRPGLNKPQREAREMAQKRGRDQMSSGKEDGSVEDEDQDEEEGHVSKKAKKDC